MVERGARGVDESEIGRFGDLALRGGYQQVGLLGDGRPVLGRWAARFQRGGEQPQQRRNDGRFSGAVAADQADAQRQVFAERAGDP